MARILALITLCFLSTIVGFSQNTLELDMFELERHVSPYPPFKIADSIPQELGSVNRKFQYYLHEDAQSYLYLGRQVDFILAVTDPDKKIVSISVVTKFDSELVTDLIKKYGRWTTASKGSTSDDSLDISKFSYYVWKLDDSSIDLRINRYMTQLGAGIPTNDYAIISRRSKNYWDSK